MNGKHFIGERAASFQRTGTSEPADGVRLAVDETTVYLAGDQSGNVLEVECPYGTQKMADTILAAVKGRSCVGYEATGAALPPTAELGDGVTVKGVYAPLVSQSINFGPGHLSDIGAPGESQVSHEFGYTDPVQRAIDRKAAQTRSYIDKQADAIRIGVEEMEKGVSAELDLKVGRDENDQIVSMLNASADVINIKGNRLTIDSDKFKVAADGSIDCTGGKIGSFEIVTELNGFSLTNGSINMFGPVLEVARDQNTYSEMRPDAVVTTGSFVGKLDGPAVYELWRNYSPASSFPAQTLTIPGLSDYNVIIVVQNYGTSSPSYMASGVYYEDAGASLALNCGTYSTASSGNGHVSSQRVYGFASKESNRMTVSAGRILNNSGMTEDNAFGIPLAVLGVKGDLYGTIS